MSIPEAIKAKRPKNFGAVEIREIGGKYYVYQVSSKWDAEKGRPQKVTGKLIGKITLNDGFIANANGLRLMQEKRLTPYIAPKVKGYGAYEMLRQLSPQLEEQLRTCFPDIFRELRTIALLRLVNGVTSARMMQPIFLDTYMSDTCGDLAMSETPVLTFVTKLGNMQNRIDAFMRESVIPGASLLFDGTFIFSRSHDSLSERGYNPDHGLNPQARILYVFDKDSHKPVFYRVVQGSIVDKSAFVDTVIDSGCKDCTIIADKGFYSKKNVSALQNAGMKYILPLQDNTANVETEFYDELNDNKFDDNFTYKKRLIWYKKKAIGKQGNFVYTFRDDQRRDTERGHYVETSEKRYEKEEETRKKAAERSAKSDAKCEEETGHKDVLNKVRMGYFSYYSNLDISAKELYLEYKQRWDIEECFSYLKNSVCTSASYAHNDAYFQGWAFLNHLSLLYFYGLVNALRNTKLNRKYTPEDVIGLTKNIYKVDAGYGDEYRVSQIQNATQELLDKLGVTLIT